MQRIPESSTAGFTLLETVVATSILVTALAGLAQLLVLSARSAHGAGSQDAALLAAQDKMEVLRSLDFTYDPVGAPITDGDLASASSLSLAEDTAGFVDYLTAAGAEMEVNHGNGAALTRRWRLTPIAQLVPEAIAVEVCVFRWPAEGLSPRAAEVCLATIRVRQP